MRAAFGEWRTVNGDWRGRKQMEEERGLRNRRNHWNQRKVVETESRAAGRGERSTESFRSQGLSRRHRYLCARTSASTAPTAFILWRNYSARKIIQSLPPYRLPWHSNNWIIYQRQTGGDKATGILSSGNTLWNYDRYAWNGDN